MERFEGLTVDWIFGATEQKKLLKLLAMSIGLVRNSPLLLTIVFGDSDSLVFREIIYVIPFHVFFIFLFFLLFLN